MNLTLLRHAHAEDRAPGGDRKRQLTEKGVAQAQRCGTFGKWQGWQPSIVLTSPYLRAWQTAKHCCDSAGWDPPVEEEAFASGVSPEDAVTYLGEYQELGEVIVIGHEPDLSLLLGYLLGTPSGAISVSKASFWGLRCSSVRQASAQLRFVVPEDLLCHMFVEGSQ
ncbi:MAG: histidine phosphatase family protein [Verrucomicrobiota bacterium]